MNNGPLRLSKGGVLRDQVMFKVQRVELVIMIVIDGFLIMFHDPTMLSYHLTMSSWILSSFLCHSYSPLLSATASHNSFEMYNKLVKRCSSIEAKKT